MSLLKLLAVLVVIPSAVYGGECQRAFKKSKELKIQIFNPIKELKQLDLASHLKSHDINAREINTKDTLLHKAVEIKDTELIENLIAEGASPYLKNENSERVIESEFFQKHLRKIINNDPGRHGLEPGIVYNIYLAGPEVFLTYGLAAGDFLKAQIALFNARRLNSQPYKLRGLFPFDVSYTPKNMDFNDGVHIFNGNEKLMSQSDAIMANMVKFRGPGMDGGTAFEMGAMHAKGKIVVGYYDEKPFLPNPKDNRDLIEKVKEETETTTKNNITYDSNNLMVEPFDMPDNLMMVVPAMGEKGEWPIGDSSWEALLVLKQKLDQKRQKEADQINERLKRK